MVEQEEEREPGENERGPRCDGVAEELTLKTNEITRKRSDFLEGTYAVHGIEEVMAPSDVVFVVDATTCPPAGP